MLYLIVFGAVLIGIANIATGHTANVIIGEVDLLLLAGNIGAGGLEPA